MKLAQYKEEDIKPSLKNLDLFILDNSVRESTVGQLRSHTLQDKIQIYEQVKECGIEDIIVASFTDMKRVDDDFLPISG